MQGHLSNKSSTVSEAQILNWTAPAAISSGSGSATVSTAVDEGSASGTLLFTATATITGSVSGNVTYTFTSRRGRLSEHYQWKSNVSRHTGL